jgi:hypothetical protein
VRASSVERISFEASGFPCRPGRRVVAEQVCVAACAVVAPGPGRGEDHPHDERLVERRPRPSVGEPGFGGGLDVVAPGLDVLRRLDHPAAADVALAALGCWAAVDDELDGAHAVPPRASRPQ